MLAQWREVRLELESSFGKEVLEDKEFPFEFSIPVRPDSKVLNLRLSGTTATGEFVKGKGFKLELNPSLQSR